MIDVVKPVELVPKVYSAPVPFRYKLVQLKVLLALVPVDVNLPNSAAASVAIIAPAVCVTNAPKPPVAVADVLNISLKVKVAAVLLNITGP